MDDDEELRKIRERKLATLIESAKKESAVPVQEGPVILTDSNFAQVIRSSRLMLVDFWAVWCAPCRTIAPFVEDLGRRYAGRLVVGKMNVDENTNVPAQLGIQSIPTLLLFKDGKLVDGIVGAVPRAHLEAFVKNWL